MSQEPHACVSSLVGEVAAPATDICAAGPAPTQVDAETQTTLPDAVRLMRQRMSSTQREMRYAAYIQRSESFNLDDCWAMTIGPKESK